MKLIVCQHEWVKHCRLRYRCDPPMGYHFEEAHFPLSRALGGSRTVRLWYPDHIVQGCLQTWELNYPCLDPRKVNREREVVLTVYPEHLGLYERTLSWCQSFFAKRLHDEKLDGKSVHASRIGKLSDPAIRVAASHAKKNEEGKSVHAVNLGKNFAGKFWWNNGEEHRRSSECPGEGWVRGRFTGHRRRV